MGYFDQSFEDFANFEKLSELRKSDLDDFYNRFHNEQTISLLIKSSNRFDTKPSGENWHKNGTKM